MTSWRDIEARLSRLEQLDAIARLRNRYCQLVDAERWREAAALFTADGTYEGGLGAAAGREAIERLFSESVPGRMARAWHHTHDGVTDLDGTQATGTVSHELFFIIDGEARMALGRYEDAYRREEGGEWLFERRRTVIDVHCGWAEGFASAPAVRR